MRFEESWIQAVVVRFLRSEYPEIIFTCVPAFARSIQAGKRNKALGYHKGWPDLFIAEPRSGFHGMFIEFKTLSGSVTREQAETMKALTEKGYYVVIHRSVDEAIVDITRYFFNKLKGE